MPYSGEIICGTYQIVEQIGKGGVGIVYLAYHLNLQKYVVVKKIKDNYVGVLEARAEVDILKSLHHNNLPQVYDFLQIGNEVYTVMEYIEGYDLKYYIDQGYKFDEQTLWSWFLQLCEVLKYLHERKILHLDIKPANIMITAEGKVYLIDFNISLSGENDSMSGISQYYASPEQFLKWQGTLFQTKNKDIVLDARTDIYSLGISFYHMMTGHVPNADLTKFEAMKLDALPYSIEFTKMIGKMIFPGKEFRFRKVEDILKYVHKNQRSKEERNTLRMVFGAMSAGILILMITVGILLFRNQFFVSSTEKESIALQEKRANELCMAGEYQTAYEEMVYFINTKSEVIDKVEGARLSFYEQLADCCMEMGKYSEALYYFQEARKLEEKLEYIMEMAVAYAYLGDFKTAESYLDYAQKSGAAEEIENLKAEILTAKGEREEAIRLYQQIESTTNNATITRKIGVLALEMAKENVAYREVAISSFVKLKESEQASYTDNMNLVSAYLLCNQKERAFSLLQEMCVLYPQKYEVFSRFANLKYQEEIKKVPAERNFAKVKEAAKKAIQIYESKYKQENEEITLLKQLLESLS